MEAAHSGGRGGSGGAPPRKAVGRSGRDAIDAIEKFLAERAKMSGIDPSQIAMLNTGVPGREASLLRGDLELILALARIGVDERSRFPYDLEDRS